MVKDFVAAHHRVGEQAASTPGRVAIVAADGRTVSYAELAANADAIASRLNALGVGTEDRVPVLLDRSPQTIAAMLGVLGAGAAYVPIDPNSPDARIRATIAQLGASVLITDRDDVSALATDLRVISPASAIASPHGEPPRISVRPEQLAYVIHTSGSTGVPKGVAMSHRGLARLVDWQIADGASGLRTLMFTPVAFDVTFQEVFSTLATGGTLVLVDDRIRRDPDALLSALDALAVERLFLPYAALQQLAAAANRGGVVPRALMHVVTAGERLIVTDPIRTFFLAMPRTRLDNHYGPTEAHLVTAHRLDGDPATWPELPPIGRPVDGVIVHALDSDGQPVQAGQVGELYVGGIGVARGYLGDPRRTAERFVPDALAEYAGSAMYRTGDLVRITAEQVVEFVGRNDDQLKVRGFRVEPAEVEHALCEHPRVREAAVGLRTLAEGVPALVAYVVVDGGEIDHRDFSAHLQRRVPDYMIPARYFSVERMPLTGSGKIDRRALAEIAIPDASDTIEDGSLFDLVQSIWRRVLGHDDFAADDDFFDVGGDSLLATWVVTELSLALGREVSLSLFLDAGTIEASVAALAELRPESAAKRAAALGELATLKAGPAHQVLILVHPLGGELIAYREFAQAIATRVRVLGLRLGNAGDREQPPMSLETMAQRHLERLVAIQPHGPYRLAGWSFGGVLAYEIARQLRARGETVDFLGMIDANPVLDPLSGQWTRDSRLREECDAVLARMEDDGIGATEALAAYDRVRDLLGGVVPDGITAAHLRRYLRSARDGILAASGYAAQPYDGDIDLFQASKTHQSLQTRLATELGELARGGLRIHMVEGDHFGILRGAHAVATARAFDVALQSSMTRTGG